MILSHPAASLTFAEALWLRATDETQIFWENSKKQEPRQKSAFDRIAV